MTFFIVNSVLIIAFLVFLALQGSSSSPSKPVDWIASIKARLLQMMAGSKDMRRFSGFTSAPIAWIRNSSLWANAFDFSGTAAGINGLGGVGGGTLITPRHVLFANHVPYRTMPFPFDIFFVNNAGKTLAYKVTAIQQVGITDIAIGTLDRDVDSSLAIYPILPDNWTEYTSGNAENPAALPVLYSDSEKKICTGDLIRVRDGTGTVVLPSFDGARPYAEDLVVGDSGNPIFVMVGDKLTLLGAWHTGSYGNIVGTFPWLIDYRPQVEAITGIPLRTANLSGFKKVA